jgi:hypothetical protein
MKKILYTCKSLIGILFLGCTVSLSACSDHPKQQEGEVAMDTTAGQDELYIDTTSSISYGIAGEVIPEGSPDQDTLKYIDRGEKPENAFQKK